MYLRLNKRKNLSSRNKTALWVIAGHVSVLILVFLVFCIKGCTAKTPKTIRVSIVSSSQLTMKPTSQQPREQVRKTPVPSPPKEPVTPKKVIPEKTWKALDPSQIRKSTTTVIKKSPARKTSSHKITPVKSSDIAKNLRQEFKKIKFDNAYEASESVLNYYDKVSQFLYGRWQQPSRSVVGRDKPVVKVRVSIDRNGRILTSFVSKKSGIAAMDESVEKLLSGLSYLPAPPEGPMKFDIYLELTD